MRIVAEKPRLLRRLWGNKLVIKQRAKLSAPCNSIPRTIARVGEVRREGSMGSCLLSPQSREFEVYTKIKYTKSTKSTPVAGCTTNSHSDVHTRVLLFYLAQAEGLH